MPALPTGTVTFLFTDIEGSTRLLQELGERYAEVLAIQRQLLGAAFQAAGGQVVDTQGDAFFVAFRRARDALAAAIAAQRAIISHPWPEECAVRVRMGLHTGEPLAADSGYVGMDVHRAARIGAAGHGGQILLSQTTRDLVVDDLAPGVLLRDLGQHRLKDLATPQHLFQVVAPELPADFPPLKSLDTLPNNLPRQLTSFIGRGRELAEVRELLSRTSLLTLTGAGGCGKTRLAIQVAADLLERYADGVWLVELAALSDPALVPQTIASLLGVREQGGRPLLATLNDALQHKQLLLVLDNCEHLLSACATLAVALLRSCPDLTILATSREGFGVAGELTYRVPSLMLADPDHLPALEPLAQQEAVRLFTERAAFALPSFRLTPENARPIAEVCRRLDGIPLAIELAAARVGAMSAQQIADRLDDRFRLLTGGSRTALPRHQTLQAAMDWSHALLEEPERILLRRLAVFSGGWGLEAAEAACAGDGIDTRNVLELLLRLVNKSLVIAEPHAAEARYRLLETVRQYAREKLVEAGEAPGVRERHLQWYLQLAERAEPELTGPQQAAWMQRLEAERDNLRASLEWSRTEEGGERALRLAGALWRFWNVHGYWTEGRGWLEEALARAGKAPGTPRAKALFGAGVLAWYQKDDAGMEARLEECLALARGLGDGRLIADTLRLLGHLAWDQDEFDRAGRLGAESLALFQEIGDKPGIASAFRFLGFNALNLGEARQAVRRFEESLQLARGLRDERGIAWSLHGLGDAALLQGDYDRATVLHNQALGLFRKLGDKFGTANALSSLAQIATVHADYERATALYEQALLIRKETGSKGSWELGGLGFVARAQGNPEGAKALYTEALAASREEGDRLDVREALLGLGLIAADEADAVQAASLLEESLRLFRAAGNRLYAARALDALGVLARRRGDLSRATALHREALVLRWELGDRLGVAESLEGAAALAAAEGQLDRAAVLLGAAEAARERIGAPRPPVDRPGYERALAATRQGLGEERFRATWAAGQAMTEEEVHAYALGSVPDVSAPPASATPHPLDSDMSRPP